MHNLWYLFFITAELQSEKFLTMHWTNQSWCTLYILLIFRVITKRTMTTLKLMPVTVRVRFTTSNVQFTIYNLQRCWRRLMKTNNQPDQDQAHDNYYKILFNCNINKSLFLTWKLPAVLFYFIIISIHSITNKMPHHHKTFKKREKHTKVL